MQIKCLNCGVVNPGKALTCAACKKDLSEERRTAAGQGPSQTVRGQSAPVRWAELTVRERLTKVAKAGAVLLMLAAVVWCLVATFQWYEATEPFRRFQAASPGFFPEKITPEERQKFVQREFTLRQGGLIPLDNSGRTGIEAAEEAKKDLAAFDRLATEVDRKRIADSTFYLQLGVGGAGLLVGGLIRAGCRPRQRNG